ncbi:MAG: alpha/beta hydrolase-fold protein [Chloroflexota bacterium]
MPNRQATFQSANLLSALFGSVLTLLLGLAACNPAQASQPVTASPQPSASRTPIQLTPSLTASKTPQTSTATPSLTPTPACTTQPGQVEEVALETTHMYQPFKFRVYLPPCYAQETDQHYPVLYLFHGLFYGDDQWARIGVVEVANRLISTGEIAPFMIVMPYDSNGREPGSTFFDEVFMEDLLPYIDANYRSLPQAAYRALGGLSRGAGWALHFGLTNPSLFGIIGAHSPIIFWEDSPEIGKWLDAIPASRLPRIYVDIGDSDPDPGSALLMEKLLTERNILHDFHTSPGYHTEQYWESQVESYLRWYAAGW